MAVDWVRKHCLSFPHVTESVQWGSNLVFKIGGKMFAVADLEPGGVWLSLKCSPEVFADLTEREGIIPAPYLARAQWVALETEDALRPGELKGLLRDSYALVLAKLPKKAREAVGAAATRSPGPRRGR
jgi:predicted DNA-binding protein (MmcQ/YjbR family)